MTDDRLNPDGETCVACGRRAAGSAFIDGERFCHPEPDDDRPDCYAVAQRDAGPGGVGINGVIPGSGRCVAPDCGAAIAEGRLMCDGHWDAVPNDVAAELNEAMWRWRTGIANLGELRDAQWACVEAVGA